MKTSEIIVFIVYLLCMLGIGIFFFVKNRNGGEKTYFLGGREMGPWVAALSAGASDMSTHALMSEAGNTGTTHKGGCSLISGFCIYKALFHNSHFSFETPKGNQKLTI